ncbi:winged helix-turn-helix transcriptional regulator [Patescibacteria group bacterium]
MSPSKYGVQARKDNRNKNIEKIVDYLRDNKYITNDEAEEMLHVSHATVTRYFDRLEGSDVIEQVGKTGRGVRYTLKKG